MTHEFSRQNRLGQGENTSVLANAWVDERGDVLNAFVYENGPWVGGGLEKVRGAGIKYVDLGVEA